MKLAEISIKRPTIVVVLFTVLSLLGFISYRSLNYEMLPEFSPGVVTILTTYPGASPNEVENTVTKKIENAVASMENIKKLTATSYESLSMVMIQLNSDADVDFALNDAQRKVNAILADLPEDVKTPSLNKFSLDDLPIITMSATSNMDDAAFYDLIDNRILPRLSRVDGVAQVNIIGGREREIQVNLDENKLEAYGLSLPGVQQAIQSSNLDFPTGSIKTEKSDILVRLAGKYASVEELRNLVVSDKGGIQVRLRDVADVQDAQKDVEKIARVDRKAAIALQVLKQTDANAVEVSKQARQMINTLMGEYKNINLQLTVASDSSTYTLESADAVIHDLILAVILVAFVMLFFLHSLRNAAIVMVSIPASLIATFIGIKLFGFTLNLMSLLGLSLVVGILVDDAIVVLENIYRHMEMGKNKVRAAYDATKEIGFTVTSITLVIIVVFFPIAISTGLVSDILRQFCIVVIIATLLSLLASFTIVPLLSSRFGKLERMQGTTFFGRIVLRFERGLDKFTHWITGLLTWSLGHKLIVLLGTFVLFIASFALVGAGFVGTEFFPISDRGEFLVQVEMPKDASVEQTNLATSKAEAFLARKPEITRLITTVGQTSDGLGGQRATAYKSEIDVQLVDRKERNESSDVYAAKIKKELAPLMVGTKITTTPVSILGSAERAPVEVVVMGPALDSVMKFAKVVEQKLSKIQGTTGIKLSVEEGNPEVRVQVDRDKMSSLGLNLQTVGMTMQTAFNGNTDSKFRQGEYEYDINIRLDNFNRQSVEDVKNLTFVNNNDEKIHLEQFATVTESSGPSQLERQDKSTKVSVQSQVVGRPSGTIFSELEDQIKNLPRPVGVSYVYGGDMENQSEGFGTLGVALLMSIILVYLIMVALYDNYVHPFVVMFSIPLSVIGALLALALTNNSLNIFTILGLIMLIGLVAKNAIILVDFTNQQKSEGKTTREALIGANHARLRPILMTTIAMVIGMLPIAIAKGAGAEWKNGLAWVIIGGLVSSLFLTLIIVPVIYEAFDHLMTKVGLNKKHQNIEELMKEPYTEKKVEGHEYEVMS